MPIYRALSDDVFKTAARNGLDPTLTPDSVAAIKRIQELADPRVGPVSFQTLDLMRQIANDAKGAVKPADRRVASIVVDKMDDYIDKLATKDIVAGNAGLASETIVVARDLWHRASKLDTVTDIIERAKNNVSKTVTFEHALRTQFRQLANNKAKLRTFMPDEQKAIKLAARGTVAMKTARGASKMAPRGIVSATLGGGAGAAVASAIGLPPMLGSAAAFAIGETGAQVANALAKRGVRQLEELIAQGGRSEMAVASIQRANRMLSSLQSGTTAASTAGALEPQRRRK